ncbi:MAG: peptide deformylase [Roseiflexaceae bacterium]|nr:peptide deformylase [Roseiflexaceae bacterium]
MAVRRILQIDDAEDKKLLKAKARQVQLPNPHLKQLIADMFETMHAANGVGLAAPQIGLAQRLAVIYIPPEIEEREDGTQVEVAPSEEYTLINPEIIKRGEQQESDLEGCLSLPGWYGQVPRPNWVTVEFSALDGKRYRLRKVDGLLARAIQHEIDHLDGVLFTERIRDLSTLKDHRKEEQPEPANV